MHLKKHLFYIFLGLLALGLFYFYAISSFFHAKQVARYENLTELGQEYEAAGELEQARKAYPVAREARILTGRDLGSRKALVLTFDGMGERGDLEAIFQMLQRKGWKATFFVEGINGAHESVLLQQLGRDGQDLENYSFVGLAHGERLDPDQVLVQLVQTQKVLKVAAGQPARVGKLGDTRYTPEICRVASASGLEALVQSDLELKPGDLTDPDKLVLAESRIHPGMVLSLRMDHPVPPVPKKKVPVGTPAIDKMPTVEDKQEPAAPARSLVQGVEDLCDWLAHQGWDVVPVTVLLS